MRSMPLVLATAVSMALLPCGVAVADTVTTDFEPSSGFTTGSVHGQVGWHSAVPGNIPALPLGYDQEVFGVSGIPGFGTQSLRHSNAYNEPTGELFYQTYSSSTAQSAGENEPNTEYIGEFSFISAKPAAQQPGLYMTMAPDNSTGGRMSGVRLIDAPGGIRAIIYDTPNPTTGDFVAYPAPSLYSRDEVHTVRFWIKFVPGENNDIVRIYIDGKDIGNELGVCFTSWENFYRATDQAVPVTNSIMFRAAGGEVPSLVGGGFLFDKVTNTTANGRGPAGCGEEGPPHRHRQDDTNAVRAAGRPHHVPDHRQKPRRRAGAQAAGVRPGAACTEVPRIYGASAARGGPSTVPHDPSAAARSAQDVPCHLPAARERHGGYRHQRRERGHPHRVRAVSVPARKRRHPQAAATPARQGLREDQGGDCSPSLPVGAESPRAHAAC